METTDEAGQGRAGFTAYCPRCRSTEIFSRAKVNHPRQLLLTILTAGLWAIPWAAFCLGAVLRPWRCQACGWHKPEFREVTCKPVPIDPNTPKKVQPPTVE